MHQSGPPPSYQNGPSNFQNRGPPAPPNKSQELVMLEALMGEFKGLLKRIELVETHVAQNASNVPRPSSQLHVHPNPNPKVLDKFLLCP